MKSCLAILFTALLTGCTTTTVTTEQWSVKRTSFLQRVEIPEVTMTTNGMVALRGYKSDGGNEALAAAIAAAVSAAINAMKP